MIVGGALDALVIHVKTVIFDLGNVIVPFDLARGYAALGPYCPYPPGEIPQRMAASGLVPPFEVGRIPPQEFAARLSAVLGLEVDFARFRELWSSIFLPETLVSERLLEGLRRRYRMLLLSNTDAIHFPWVRERYPLLGHFDDYVLSYQVGAAKPDARIFQAAIDRAACRAGECFFTDDIPSNVEAARQAGLDAVRFENAAQIERELKARGLEW
ncbi:MAG: HAD family hydrolase [Bryobacteraceae bacterium]